VKVVELPLRLVHELADQARGSSRNSASVTLPGDDHDPESGSKSL